MKYSKPHTENFPIQYIQGLNYTKYLEILGTVHTDGSLIELSTVNLGDNFGKRRTFLTSSFLAITRKAVASHLSPTIFLKSAQSSYEQSLYIDLDIYGKAIAQMTRLGWNDAD